VNQAIAPGLAATMSRFSAAASVQVNTCGVASDHADELPSGKQPSLQSNLKDPHPGGAKMVTAHSTLTAVDRAYQTSGDSRIVSGILRVRQIS
jgi:hypothetical protein